MDFWKMNDINHHIIEKSFSGMNFLMTIPEISLLENKISFLFHTKIKPESENFKCALVASSFMNVFGEIQRYNDFKTVFQSSKTISCVMPVPNIKGLTKSEIAFLYLCNNGIKYAVSYYIQNKWDKPILMRVEQCQMTEDEISYLNNLPTITNSTLSITSNEGKVVQYSSVELIPEYTKALQKEVIFLKNNGGNKHNVSNGCLLSNGKEGYCYIFEMESELFLPDDAPLLIDTNAGIHAEGSVLVCEEFRIIIMVNRDLGEKVYKAQISVEPWKLLVAQIDRISKINSHQHPLAINLTQNGPAIATNASIVNIPKGQEAVKTHVENENITIVWGPPGTGKTYTMSDIAIDYLRKGKSVLIVSHSNVSVDGVIKRVAEKLRNSYSNNFLKEGKVFRYGYIRDKELSQDDEVSSFNYAMNHSKDFKNQLDSLLDKKEKMKSENRYFGAQLVEIEKELGRVRGKIREQEKFYVNEASLVGTTISKITVDTIFENKKYDLVMFDEISMAYVSQIVCAASFSRKKLVCVGDFMQLPPIAQNESAKNWLEKDIFEYLRITDSEGNLYYHPWLVMLDTQRRMYPDIANFVNKRVYKNLLLNHESTTKNNLPTIEANPLAGHALNMIDLQGTYCAATKNVDNSRFNILSAVISFGTAVSSKTEDKTIGIITPYSAQMRLIRAMIKDCKSDIVCSTVHQFQGSESDVIVFDSVESYPTSKAGYLMSKNLHSVKRLINVAITRAKGKFITVANSRFWTKEFENKKNHIYYQLVNHIADKHNVISLKEQKLQNFLSTLNTGNNIKFFMTQDESWSSFEKDFNTAENQIVISIPDGRLKGQFDKVWELIQKAEKRGIQILMKSSSYAELPDEWKQYCIGTENAYFPLIMIDGKTIWYGLPLSRGEFRVKDYGFTTVCDTILRIKGESTIEMISSLSELTLKRIGLITTPLLPKKVDGVGLYIGSAGKIGYFPEWITKQKFCPKCKHHLVLAKGKTGKFYLRCPQTGCDHIEYLTKEMVNHYLNIHNVTCPKCGAELWAKLGQYGVYIICNNKDSIKPDQI